MRMVIFKMILVIILLSFAVKHTEKSSDFYLTLSILEIALSIGIIIQLIKQFIKKS